MSNIPQKKTPSFDVIQFGSRAQVVMFGENSSKKFVKVY